MLPISGKLVSVRLGVRKHDLARQDTHRGDCERQQRDGNHRFTEQVHYDLPDRGHAASLNHLISAGEDQGRDREAEYPTSLARGSGTSAPVLLLGG